MLSNLLVFCRMPDPDFSVNDVKMFVGKTWSFLPLINSMLQVSVLVLAAEVCPVKMSLNKTEYVSTKTRE